MSKVYSAASLYANLDRMDTTSLNEWLAWHKALKYAPRYVVLFSAARMNDAPDVLRRIKDTLPDTTIVWRAFDGRDPWGAEPANGKRWDDSNFYMQLEHQNAFISPSKAAQMWVDRRVMPHQKVITETNTVVMLLNEADPVFNAWFEAACIKELGEEGIRAGAFAWAAGTPDWPDYAKPQIEDAVKMAAKYNALIMPHEYAGVRVEEQNSLIARFKSLHQVYTRLGLPLPDTLIGELAACKARVEGNKIILDPDVGWRMMDIDEIRFVDFLHGTIKNWYLPDQVSSSIFDWAGWGTNDSFKVRGATRLLDTLRALLDNHLNFEVDASTAPVPQPPPVVEVPPVVINPHPNPPPLTGEGTIPTVTKRYGLEITANEVQHQAIEMALLDVLDAVTRLGKAMAGAQASIVTT